jgi:hypothetical protein
MRRDWKQRMRALGMGVRGMEVVEGTGGEVRSVSSGGSKGQW